jgi:CRISPR-associated protein Cas4
MNENTDNYIRVNDIKNAIYCPRISYYELCMRIDLETDLSKAGIREEQATKTKMKRRKQALHSVHQGERKFDVALVNHELKIVGRIDEIVSTEQGIYLVDYKDTDKDYGYWKLQLTAYQLCAKEMGYTVLGCYIYIIPKKSYKEVKPTSKDVEKLRELCLKVEEIVQEENFPPPNEIASKCYSCQYIRLCNDVL